MRKFFQLSALTAIFALLSGLLIGPAMAAKDDPYDERRKNREKQSENEAALEHTDEKLVKAYEKLEATKEEIVVKEGELAAAEEALAEAQRAYDSLVDKLSVAEEQEEGILGEIEDDETRFDDRSEERRVGKERRARWWTDTE